MSGNVKKSLEKKIDVEKIVNKLLSINRLKLEEMAIKTGITLDALRKSITRGVLSKGSVQKILDKFDVNEGFLKEEEDLLLSGKLTSVQTGGDIKEKPLRVEGGNLIIPQEIFHKEYIIVPKAMYQYLHARLLGLQNDEVVKKTKKKI